MIIERVGRIVGVHGLTDEELASITYQLLLDYRGKITRIELTPEAIHFNTAEVKQ